MTGHRSSKIYLNGKIGRIEVTVLRPADARPADDEIVFSVEKENASEHPSKETIFALRTTVKTLSRISTSIIVPTLVWGGHWMGFY
jgi:hypothetical protein